MRSYTPGGRFDPEFETNDILDAISKDLTVPVGTKVQWYVWVGAADTTVATSGRTVIDSVYDVGSTDTSAYVPGVAHGGRKWRTPVEVPVVRAVVTQGQAQLNQRGLYGPDMLHLTIDKEDLFRRIPDLMDNPDPLDRDRILWKGQLYRPRLSQQQGIIAERFTIMSFDCIQVMPEEMVNDPQFQAYAK